jgi:hypothetical protein
VVVLTPSLAMGFLRDDWLLLWAALDPSGAPEGARGLFFRPVADAQWWIAARVSGDSPWGMHLLVGITWLALLAAVDRWLQKWTEATRLDRALALLLVAAHAALVEPRLWAAAGNGVLASALGAWGAWWIAKSNARSRGLGVLL